jgi:hypothetical protein
MDWPAALAWNSRPDSRGMGGRFGLEWVADFSGIHRLDDEMLELENWHL